MWYHGRMSEEVCICGKVVTDRIGEIAVPNRKERSIKVYRFALDCPVHGIKVLEGEDRSVKKPVEEPISRAEQNRINRQERRKRRLARQEEEDARHPDVPPAGLLSGEELPEEPA